VVEGTDGVADGVREADEAGRRGGSWGRRRAVAPWGRWGRRERETAPARRSSVGKMGAAAWGRVSRNGRVGRQRRAQWRRNCCGAWERWEYRAVWCGEIGFAFFFFFLFSLFYGVQPLFF